MLHGPTSLFSSNHNLEAIQVRELLAASVSLHLKVSAVGGPLLIETKLSSSLGEGTSSAATLDRDYDLSQSESLERINNSWELLSGCVDQNASGIENVDDHDQFAIVFAKIDEANSTWFNEIFKTLIL